MGLAAHLLLTLAALWAPLRRVSPAGMRDLPAALAAGRPAEALGPVLSTLALVVLLCAAAVLVFRRREL